jgi:S1-C subfamily serine protease
MKLFVIAILSMAVTMITVNGEGKSMREVADHLQDISVTIKSEGEYSRSEGSGAMIIREVNGQKVTFVWTAAHVIDNLRSVRSVINESGQPVKVVEFEDPKIVKELVESGRRVGEIKMDARVIKYSNADTGEDLALLMVRAKDYAKSGAAFKLNSAKKKDDDNIVPIGTRLFHVGSLLGQMGANSMTTGIISQVGRTLGKVEYDQTTVTAFPGSSGGGVYLTDGRYMGMLVRGAGEGFNLIVPVRRMIRWAEKNDIMWAIDPSVKMPSLDEIDDIPVEDSGVSSKKKSNGDDKSLRSLPYLIKVTPIGHDRSLNDELNTRPTEESLSPKLELR